MIVPRGQRSTTPKASTLGISLSMAAGGGHDPRAKATDVRALSTNKIGVAARRRRSPSTSKPRSPSVEAARAVSRLQDASMKKTDSETLTASSVSRQPPRHGSPSSTIRQRPPPSVQASQRDLGDAGPPSTSGWRRASGIQMASRSTPEPLPLRPVTRGTRKSDVRSAPSRFRLGSPKRNEASTSPSEAHQATAPLPLVSLSEPGYEWRGTASQLAGTPDDSLACLLAGLEEPQVCSSAILRKASLDDMAMSAMEAPPADTSGQDRDATPLRSPEEILQSAAMLRQEAQELGITLQVWQEPCMQRAGTQEPEQQDAHSGKALEEILGEDTSCQQKPSREELIEEAVSDKASKTSFDGNDAHDSSDVTHGEPVAALGVDTEQGEVALQQTDADNRGREVSRELSAAGELGSRRTSGADAGAGAESSEDQGRNEDTAQNLEVPSQVDQLRRAQQKQRLELERKQLDDDLKRLECEWRRLVAEKRLAEEAELAMNDQARPQPPAMMGPAKVKPIVALSSQPCGQSSPMLASQPSVQGTLLLPSTPSPQTSCQPSPITPLRQAPAPLPLQASPYQPMRATMAPTRSLGTWVPQAPPNLRATMPPSASIYAVRQTYSRSTSPQPVAATFVTRHVGSRSRTPSPQSAVFVRNSRSLSPQPAAVIPSHNWQISGSMLQGGTGPYVTTRHMVAWPTPVNAAPRSANSRSVSPMRQQPTLLAASATRAVHATTDSCPSCGSVYLQDAKFCRRCGTNR
eukprot:TRINITY_DN41734_c0_g1_i1.p1 TRINITY_DN41734_c0_g1~~TRINITY_DN41734_c0_g1_i1.p1  ORF type:complete len:748 (+),score=112.15 TRINITY_DN41734_c0_g1_i1:167-2410(+)